ncbi:PfkB family carbohydrate kinase [Rhodococcus ruber]|uniref:PfkB family carbohydrate kinase n=1 Tax=Rhodococcus ruber TaxID=1830 RepID=UPI00387DC82B
MTAVSYSRQVIGMGEVILDHIWRPSPMGGTVEGSRGGGSVFNVLANLAALGWESQLFGVAGLDTAGRYAVQDLINLGVNVKHVEFQPRRRTRLIFEALDAAENHRIGGVAHSFSTKCPACQQRILDRDRPVLRSIPNTEDISATWSVYDQLTKSRVAHARLAKAAGITTVLDLGAVSYLRYQPTTLILSHLRTFDLVFLNQRVAVSLAKRVNAPLNHLSAFLPSTVLVVTQGRHGATVSDATGKSVHIPAPLVYEVVDDSGAGDALCSYTLDALVVSEHGRQLPRRLSGSAVAEAVAAVQSRLTPVLSHVGARGHLPPAPIMSEFERLRGRHLDDLAIQAEHDQLCPLCQLPIRSTLSTRDSPPARMDSQKRPTRASKLGAKRNTSLLISRMLSAAEHTRATELVCDLLREPGTAYVIGSGGSFPAAMFISELLNVRGHFAAALNPGDYISAAKSADMVVAVSYSGNTHDIGLTIRAAKARGTGRIILLTGAPAPRLEAELRPLSWDSVVSYAPPSRRASDAIRGVRERGFVSIAGTVTPCIPWLTAAAGLNSVIDMIGRIEHDEADATSAAEALAPQAGATGRLNVIRGHGALPAALDIESKFIESGLPAVTLHEQKDLSHGRFISVFQPVQYHALADSPMSDMTAPVLVLATGSESRYQQALAKELDSAGVHSRELRVSSVDLTAPLELLTLVQFFSQTFGSKLGVDISRPTSIPEAGLNLYRWRGESI